MRLTRHGLTVDLPTGWEGQLFRRFSDDGSVTHPVLHSATFPLPPDRGDFGSGAVELMRPDDVLVVLFEYGEAETTAPLFTQRRGRPRPQPADFNPRALQRTLPGQSGCQYFFTENGRAFCLYVVLGSHAQRARLVPRVHALLDALDIERRSSW